jgi:predicted small secreted protein
LKKNRKKTIVTILLLCIGLETIKQFLNYQFGDGNGIVTHYNPHIHIYICISTIQLLIGTSACFLSLKLIKNIITINLIIIIGLLTSLELIFSFVNPVGLPFKSHGNILQNYEQLDSSLGYKPRPSTNVNSIRLTLQNDTIYNVKYTTNSYSKRYTPTIDGPVSKYALFFGGSFTFGEGVNDTETLPYFFQKSANNYKSYNFGYSGYGTQQMLANLTENNIKPQIEESEGLAVYVFISDHIRRNIGAMSFYSSWGYNHPYYYDNGKKLVHQKTFKTGRSQYINICFNFLSRSSILKFFNIDIYPPFINKNKLTARMINESFTAYKNQFKNDNFTVLVYDGGFDGIKHYLNPIIHVLDYNKITTKDKYKLHPIDNHPNKHGYEIVAKQLTTDLKILK